MKFKEFFNFSNEDKNNFCIEENKHNRINLLRDRVKKEKFDLENKSFWIENRQP